MDEIIKLVAKYLIALPVLVELYIFWKLDKTNRHRMLYLVFFTAVLSVVLAKIGAQLFSDPRPQFKDGSTPLFAHGNDNGFPSDHTLLASVLALGAYRFNKRIGYGLLAAAVLIGWARVAAHVHHAVDIAGSLVIAAVAYVIVVKLLERFKPNER